MKPTDCLRSYRKKTSNTKPKADKINTINCERIKIIQKQPGAGVTTTHCEKRTTYLICVMEHKRQNERMTNKNTEKQVRAKGHVTQNHLKSQPQRPLM